MTPGSSFAPRSGYSANDTCLGNKFGFLAVGEMKEGLSGIFVKCQQIVSHFDNGEYLIRVGLFEEGGAPLGGAGACEGGEKVVVAENERPHRSGFRHSVGGK